MRRTQRRAAAAVRRLHALRDHAAGTGPHLRRDCAHICAGTARIAAHDAEPALQLWALQGHSILGVLYSGAFPWVLNEQGTRVLYLGLLVQSTATTLFSSGGDGVLRVWDINTAEQARW